MRSMMKVVSMAALAVAVAGLASASTTSAIRLSTGGLIATITDNGACTGSCGTLGGDSDAANGTITVSSGDLGGWHFSFTSGTTHSPGLTPDAIDLGSLVASCTSSCSGAGALHIMFSDINFSVPVGIGGFNTFYSATLTGTATTSESAYFSNLDTLFTETSLIGTVGPFIAPGGSGTAAGGLIAAVPNYSLTLDAILSASGSGSFSIDGNITSTPEPTSILLLSTLVLGIGLMMRRRQNA